MNVRVTVALAATVLSLTACGAAREGFEDGAGVSDPAPRSCLDAISAAERGFGLAVEANEVMINWIGGVPTQAEIDEVERITQELAPVVERFNTTKTECREN